MPWTGRCPRPRRSRPWAARSPSTNVERPGARSAASRIRRTPPKLARRRPEPSRATEPGGMPPGRRGSARRAPRRRSMNVEQLRSAPGRLRPCSHGGKPRVAASRSARTAPRSARVARASQRPRRRSTGTRRPGGRAEGLLRASNASAPAPPRLDRERSPPKPRRGPSRSPSRRRRPLAAVRGFREGAARRSRTLDTRVATWLPVGRPSVRRRRAVGPRREVAPHARALRRHRRSTWTSGRRAMPHVWPERPPR
jgi:hypothetical protein